MAEKNIGGPDLMKMLQMMMPYMDEESSRMLRIMLKIRELQELMHPPAPKPPAVSSEEKTEEERKENENQEPPSPAAATDLTAQLQEGLTPQQKDMIISLSGMIK